MYCLQIKLWGHHGMFFLKIKIKLEYDLKNLIYIDYTNHAYNKREKSCNS
jgi:hypothetical protein